MHADVGSACGRLQGCCACRDGPHLDAAVSEALAEAARDEDKGGVLRGLQPQLLVCLELCEGVRCDAEGNAGGHLGRVLLVGVVAAAG